jgi:uncharacterized protein (DUF1330 family)
MSKLMLFLTQLVYVHPGKESTFHAFEEIAIPLIAKHGGDLLLRVRPTSDSVVAASIDIPYEVHVVRFKSEEDLRAFSEDGERQRVLHMKNESVRATLLVRGTLI